MKKPLNIKIENPIAATLSDPKYRKRVVTVKKKYKRNEKHKKDDMYE